MRFTSSKSGQADRKSGAELDESSIERELLLEPGGHENRHNETVDGDDTSHNDGNDILSKY